MSEPQYRIAPAEPTDRIRDGINEHEVVNSINGSVWREASVPGYVPSVVMFMSQPNSPR